MTMAVADSGPLIHLSEIGRLDLLEIFDSLYVPNAVWQETVGQGRVSASTLSNASNIRRITVPEKPLADLVQEKKIESLQNGERECIFTCLSEHVSLLLTDDLAVRNTVRQFGLTPVGSLGIVVRAFRVGRISQHEAEQQLIALHQVSSLFVTRVIVELAIEQLQLRNT